jgi:hypothetical protein
VEKTLVFRTALRHTRYSENRDTAFTFQVIYTKRKNDFESAHLRFRNYMDRVRAEQTIIESPRFMVLHFVKTLMSKLDFGY